MRLNRVRQLLLSLLFKEKQIEQGDSLYDPRNMNYAKKSLLPKYLQRILFHSPMLYYTMAKLESHFLQSSAPLVRPFAHHQSYHFDVLSLGSGKTVGLGSQRAIGLTGVASLACVMSQCSTMQLPLVANWKISAMASGALPFVSCLR